MIITKNYFLGILFFLTLSLVVGALQLLAYHAGQNAKAKEIRQIVTRKEYALRDGLEFFHDTKNEVMYVVVEGRYK